MRITLVLVGALALVACKHNNAETDAGSQTTTASTDKGSTTTAKQNDTETQQANEQQTEAPKKPPQSGCAWPKQGDHDITITKGCAVTANDNLTLTDGATMTIEDGVKISFDTDTYLWVEYGKLIVKGTAQSPVTFTSSNKSPAAGDWTGIGFKDKTMSGTTIDHLIIEDAGSKAHSGVAAIQLEEMRQGGRIAITNTIVRNSAQFGLVAGKNGTFEKFENNTFQDNKSGSLKGVAATLGSVGRGNKFNQPIHVTESTISQNTTWPAFDVPIFVDDHIHVHDATSVPTLTIADKTVLKFAPSIYIAAGDGDEPGAIVAKNVLFTSSSPAPSPGDWVGMFLGKKANGTDLENCIFEFFGSTSHSGKGAISIEDANAADLVNVTIKNVTFRHGKQQAINSNDGKCAPFDTAGNKAEGIPLCSKP